MPAHIAIAALLVSVIAAIAWVWGGGPERRVCFIVFMWFWIDPVYHAWYAPAQFLRIDLGHLIFDFTTFVALFFIALHANRVWPCWVAAASIIPLIGHTVVVFGFGGMQRAYWILTQIPLWLELLVIVIGLSAHWARRKRIGQYPDWSSEL